jgi:hypothetical protein
VSDARCKTCLALDLDEDTGPGSHCRDCHRSWRGLAEAHCAECHRHFGGEVAFTAHQASGVCRDPGTIRTEERPGKPSRPRFKLVERKHSGPTWIQNDEREFPSVGGTVGGGKTETPRKTGRKKAAV